MQYNIIYAINAGNILYIFKMYSFFHILHMPILCNNKNIYYFLYQSNHVYLNSIILIQ